MLTLHLNTTRIVRHAPPDRASWHGALSMLALAAWSVWAWLTAYPMTETYAPFAEARPYALMLFVSSAVGIAWTAALWLARRPRPRLGFSAGALGTWGSARQQLKASVWTRVAASMSAWLWWGFLFWMLVLVEAPGGGATLVAPSYAALLCCMASLRDGWSFLRLTRQIGTPPPPDVRPEKIASEAAQQRAAREHAAQESGRPST